MSFLQSKLPKQLTKHYTNLCHVFFSAPIFSKLHVMNKKYATRIWCNLQSTRCNILQKISFWLRKVICISKLTALENCAKNYSCIPFPANSQFQRVFFSNLKLTYVFNQTTSQSPETDKASANGTAPWELLSMLNGLDYFYTREFFIITT